MKKLILLVVMIVSIFTGCSNDKTKQYLEKQGKTQDENIAAFSNNYDAVSKFVFDKYPNAKTILYGDLYLTQEEPKKVKMFLRPSTTDFKSGSDFINNAGYEKLKNDSSFEQLYILTANINTDGISNIQMEPFKKSDWRDVEWKWDIYNISIKTVSYFAPFVLDYIYTYKQAGEAMGLVSTVLMPSKVVNRTIIENIELSTDLINSIKEDVKKYNETASTKDSKKLDDISILNSQNYGDTITYMLDNKNKTITVIYKNDKSIVIPFDASQEEIEANIKNLSK